MKIRPAVKTDLDILVHIYREAKKYMDKSGNPTQWQPGYPTREMLLENIRDGVLFVIEEKEVPHAAFVFFIGDDPTYSKIYNGSWLNDEKYGVIHHVASDGNLHGVFSTIADFAKEQIERAGIFNLRLDTHEDNKKMQSVIEANGFTKRGIIYLQNGSPRIAFQFRKK